MRFIAAGEKKVFQLRRRRRLEAKIPAATFSGLRKEKEEEKRGQAGLQSSIFAPPSLAKKYPWFSGRERRRKVA